MDQMCSRLLLRYVQLEKILQSFLSPAQVSEARGLSLLTLDNKMERGLGEKGRKKHVLLCAWFCSTRAGSAHGRRLSQPSVSQGNALMSPQMRSRAFGDPTVKDSACHQYYSCSRSTSDRLCTGRQRAGSTALASRANRSNGVSSPRGSASISHGEL